MIESGAWKGDGIEEGLQAVLHRRRAQDARFVEPEGQSVGGKIFSVIRPAAAKLPQRLIARRRTKPLASVEMPEQEGFVTGRLPDQVKAVPRGQGLRLRIARRYEPERVGVQKDRSNGTGAHSGRTVADMPNGPFDEAKGIARAGLQNDRIDVERQPPRIGEPSEQGAVTLLALALASEKDAAALRNWSAPVPHPIWGTAPNAPPRYLRL